MLNRIASVLLLIGISGCSSIAGKSIAPRTLGWLETTSYCDGSMIRQDLQYFVYYGNESRGAKRKRPGSSVCGAPAKDDVYQDRLPVRVGQDLCDVLPVGDWYIAMRAETAQGRISDYSNELKVTVAKQMDSPGSVCQVQE